MQPVKLNLKGIENEQFKQVSYKPYYVQIFMLY